MPVLSLLAGAFIGVDALYFVLTSSGTGLGCAAKQIVRDITFSFGLLFMSIAGTELFTGTIF